MREQSTAETHQQHREEIISTNNFEELQTNPTGKNSIGETSLKPLETRQTIHS